MNKFFKTCPKCGCEQIYCSKRTLSNAIKKHTICIKCTVENSKKHHSKFERRCKCGKILVYSCRQSLNLSKRHNSKCRSCATKISSKKIDRSFQTSAAYRQKMSASIKRARLTSTKYKSLECREKLRTARLNQIKKLGSRCNFNPKACQFIDEYGKQNGMDFKHALNGGEVIVSGYSLDGYDGMRNIVFEYDEAKHNSPSSKLRDKLRQKRIIQKINPTMFIRYDEQFHKLYDAISGKELL